MSAVVTLNPAMAMMLSSGMLLDWVVQRIGSV
jgi:hypothetical protein